jgi:hypothetical protein
MKYLTAFALIISLIFLSCGVSKVSVVKSDEIDKTFNKKDNIKMEFVSGNCQVSKSPDNLIHIRVISNVTPQENFKPQIDENENSLELREQFSGSSKGDVKWILSIPDGIKIDFSAASGNFSIENLNTELTVSVASGNTKIENSEGKFIVSSASGNITSKNSNGNFKFSTASGNLKLNNVEGKFKLNSASGNVIAENIKGEMKLNSASGDVEVTNVTVNEKCSFNTASGNVNVKLASSPHNDLSLNTASGDAILDYNGNSLSGYFEFSVKKSSGKIIAPFEFESEKEASKNSSDVYLVKSIKIGSDSPKISISTATGFAELRK